MSIEANKAIVSRLCEELNKGNLDVVDEIFAPDYFDHNPAPGMPPSIKGVKRFIAGVHKTFPDCRWNLEDLVAEGDKVVDRFTLQGTDTGGHMRLPPTGKKVTVGIIGISRISGGRITERWSIGDSLGMLQQLGIFPSKG